jgi:hypothetical protein
MGVNEVRYRLRRGLGVAVASVALIVTVTVRVSAVLFQSTSDPDYNTDAPSGVLTNSGWQYEGQWGNYLGTPIAPRFFITASHIAVPPDQVFVFNGVTNHPIALFTTLDSDLNIWEVAETFARYAPLYTSPDESNKHVVVIGRGTERGDPVVVGGLTNGWMWGTTNYVQRWGENDVNSITNFGLGVGELLKCTFADGTGSNECHLSIGDSGGAIFIQDGGVWKLAGINRSVDGPFSNTVADSESFSAAMLDMRGLYEELDPTDWVFISGPQPVPSAFYCTRISANMDWISSVINFEAGDDLQTPSVQVVSNGVQISFATSSERSYLVLCSTDLGSGAWTTFTNGVEGTGGTVSIVDTNAGILRQKFYRLEFAQ